MKGVLRKRLDNIFLSHGYRITPYKIVDLQKEFLDPRQIHYAGGYPVLATIPTYRGRSWVFALDSKFSPYAQGVKHCQAMCIPFEEALAISFGVYHNLVDPQGIFDIYGVSPEQENLGLPAPAPWSRFSLEAFSQYKKKIRTRFKVRHVMPGESKATSEGRRIAALYNSILKNGYQRDDSPDGDICATVLMREDGEWRWLVNSGNHRAMVLGALGHEKISVRLESIVYRRDAPLWPNMLNGTYTLEYAERIFDILFTGSGSPVLQRWEQELNQPLA